MSSTNNMKPITLWGHPKGPNPLKVLITICELGIPYDLKPIGFGAVKEEPFLSLNPNGRAPAIEDPNTGIILWESGAIIEYLIENYDTDHKISYGTFPEKYQQGVWKHFQMSGQGPYFGQYVWFGAFHPEKFPSAISRYENEMKRIYSVLELHLSRTGKQFLVGDKCTFADLMFIPWNRAWPGQPGADWKLDEWPKEYPLSYAWNERMIARDGVKEAMKISQETADPH